MQVYLWTNDCPPMGQLNDVNAADDAMIVYHEYTHGMTNRLVTLADGSPAHERLPGWRDGRGPRGLVRARPAQRAGLRARRRGAGRAAARQVRERQAAHPAVRLPGWRACGRLSGQWACWQLAATRTGTSARILGGAEVHADGEIWVETLWDLRNSLIAGHGRTEGITRARALVTDGLRLAPAQPDLPRHAQRHPAGRPDPRLRRPRAVWAVFAARGMGFRASTRGTDDAAPIQDFSVPPPPPPPPPRHSSRSAGVALARFTVGAASGARVHGPARSTQRHGFRISEPVRRAMILIERSGPGRRARGRCRPAKRSLSHRPRCTRQVKAGSSVRSFSVAGAQQVRWRG